MLNFPNRLVINGTEWNDRPLKFDVNCINCKTEPTWRDIILHGTTALTLVNSKADGLNYLKLFGGCEQNGTPTPTVPVDIICNNGVVKALINHWNMTKISGNAPGFNWNARSVASDGTLSLNITNPISSARIQISLTAEQLGLQAGKTYTVKVWILDGNAFGNSNQETQYIYVNGSRVDFATAGTQTELTHTWTQTGTDNVLIGTLFVKNYELGTTVRVRVMVTEGETIGDYIPHTQPGIYTDGTQEVVTDSVGNTATAQMLLSVGDYKDTQEVLNGSITRQIGIKAFDGTENWDMGGSYNQFLSREAVADRDYSAGSFGYCTHFTMASDSAKLTEYGYLILGVASQQINFSSVGLSATTVEEWKQWLADQYNAGTPVIFVYIKNSATTESVTGQPLTIQAGTNIVEITQASMDNLELEVSYKAGVAVTITEIENAQLDNNVEVTING